MRAADRARTRSTRHRLGVVGLAAVLAGGLLLPTPAAAAPVPTTGGAGPTTVGAPVTAPAVTTPAAAAPATAIAAPSTGVTTPVPQAGGYPPPELYEFGGRVLADGAPLPEVRVVVLDADTGYPVASTTTTVFGEWAFPLPPGTFKVGVVPPAPYLPEFAQDKRTIAEADVFTNPGTVPDIVVERPAPEPAAIEGQVLGWFDPLGGATVTVYDAATGAVLASQTLGELEYEYRIEGLPPGDVKVGATRPGWVADFANDRDTLEQADVFTLLPGETLRQSWHPVVLYLDLTPGAVVEGSVVANGSPVADATVELLSVDGTTVVASTTSGADGAFRLDGLAAGDVRVRATKAGLPTVYGPGDGQSVEGVYTLAPTETDTVVLDMSTQVTVQGTVRGVSEAPGAELDGPLAEVRVTAYDAATGTALATVRSDSGGAYRFADLPVTQIKVRAAKPGFVTTFANDRRTLATADVLTLPPAGTLVVDEITLFAGATVEGAATANSDPLAGITVSVLDAATGRVIRSVVSDGTRYRVEGLPPGEVKVRASHPAWITTYGGGSETLAGAAVFTLVPGQTLSGTTDSRLDLDLGAAAAVHGQVLGDGSPLEGVRVSVIDTTTGTVLRSALSDATGSYRVQGIPITGTAAVPVAIRFTKAGWVTEMAPGAEGSPPGTYPLFFFNDLTIQTVDLAREGVVVGSVLGIDDTPDGAYDGPLAGVRITAYDAATGRALRSTTTDAGGDYRLTGLPAGQVKIRGALPGWLTTFAYGGTNLATADVFPVVAGGTTTVDEFTMYAESVLTGQVLGNPEDQGELPLADVRVTAVDATTGRTVRTVLSDGDGRFRLGGLRFGDYKVRFAKDGWTTVFAVQKPTFATADVLTLVAGQTREVSPQTVLDPAASISGSILGLSGPPDVWDDPLGGVRVTAFDVATGRAVASDLTGTTAEPDRWGRFSIEGLPRGAYVLRATLPGWTTTWGVDADSAAEAQVFHVGPGQDLEIPTTWSMLRLTTLEGQVLGEMDPLGGATVTVFDASTGRALRSVVADASGYYSVTVPTAHGGFAVKVRATKSGWFPSWANGRSTMATADVFEMGEGGTLSQQWDPLVLYLDLAPRS